MSNRYTVRNIEWDKTNERGIPLDCIGVMDYFNSALEQGLYPLIPRSEPITEEEISEEWLPSKDTTITYIAIDETGKVVGAGTLFLDLEKRIGELSATKNPGYSMSGVGTDITRAIIQDALSRGTTVSVHTSVENRAAIRVMEKLGYGSVNLFLIMKNTEEKSRQIRLMLTSG